MRSCDHTGSVVEFVPRKAGLAGAIILIEAFASGVYSLTLPSCVQKESERAFGASITVEGVAVGVEVVCHYSWEAGIFDQSEPRVAGEVGSVGRVIGITLGVDWLADVLSR